MTSEERKSSNFNLMKGEIVTSHQSMSSYVVVFKCCTGVKMYPGDISVV